MSYRETIFHFAAPICGCKKQNLSWSVTDDAIFFECKTCQIRVTIPNKSWKPHLIFKIPYPADIQVLETLLPKGPPVLTVVKDTNE